MIVKKIWYNTKQEIRHKRKDVAMYGYFLFGIINLYIVEERTL